MVITKLAQKIAFGEGRARRLNRKLSLGTAPGGYSANAANWAREELALLDAALVALRYHGTSLREESSIPAILQDLLTCLAAIGLPTDGPIHDDLGGLVTRARRALKDLERCEPEPAPPKPEPEPVADESRWNR